jgi:hypothetical protein
MMWSKHSRRIDPIGRSAKPFCQGEADAVGGLVPDAHGAQSACDDRAIDLIPIADEIFWGIIPREGLRYLTRNPPRCRVCCDVDPDEVSAIEPDDDEGIEQVETGSWDNEQVHSGNIRRVITQEGPPPLAWRSSPFDNVLDDARLHDLKPELEQYATYYNPASEHPSGYVIDKKRFCWLGCDPAGYFGFCRARSVMD